MGCRGGLPSPPLLPGRPSQALRTWLLPIGAEQYGQPSGLCTRVGFWQSYGQLKSLTIANAGQPQGSNVSSTAITLNAAFKQHGWRQKSWAMSALTPALILSVLLPGCLSLMFWSGAIVPHCFHVSAVDSFRNSSCLSTGFHKGSMTTWSGLAMHHGVCVLDCQLLCTIKIGSLKHSHVVYYSLSF